MNLKQKLTEEEIYFRHFDKKLMDLDSIFNYMDTSAIIEIRKNVVESLIKCFVELEKFDGGQYGIADCIRYGNE